MIRTFFFFFFFASPRPHFASPRSISLGSLFCGLRVDMTRASSDNRYNAKFSNNASYQRYKNGTSLIIPWFPAPPASTNAAVEHRHDIVSTTPYAPRLFFFGVTLLVFVSDCIIQSHSSLLRFFVARVC
jgi:hypothetical protein